MMLCMYIIRCIFVCKLLLILLGILLFDPCYNLHIRYSRYFVSLLQIHRNLIINLVF